MEIVQVYAVVIVDAPLVSRRVAAPTTGIERETDTFSFISVQPESGSSHPIRRSLIILPREHPRTQRATEPAAPSLSHPLICRRVAGAFE